MKQFGKMASDERLKEQVKRLFFEFKERYGYKRLTTELKKRGDCSNHKKVYRLMKEMGLKCIKFMRKTRKYNFYKRKVGAIAKNRMNRRFSTPITLQKLVTDVTEFKCIDGEKLYFSPILDLYNSEVIAYGINKRPTLDFVMNPLEEVMRLLKKHAKVRTTIHSDQGWQYQNNRWVKTLKEKNEFQSISHKATCADNACIENFFGILKQEMYHGEVLMSYKTLKLKLEEYIDWYNHVRSKEKLTGLSPVDYREQTSQLAV